MTRNYYPSQVIAERAISSLSHPVSVGAMVVLMLNALLWQRVAPSWLTGKIGDEARLVFVPLLVALLLALLLPSKWTKAARDWASRRS